MTHRRTITRVAAVAATALVATAPIAGAHVSVDPGEATKGGFATLAFRVPNERDDASTVEVQVNLPTDTPLTSVRVQPTPGWEYEVGRTELDQPIENGDEEITEVVETITWTGGEIGVDEFEEFHVSVGRLPEDADHMLFPTVQIYDSGEEVRWIEDPTGGTEPESPAPMLTLVDPEDEADGSGGGADDAGAEADSEVALPVGGEEDDDGTATGLAIAAIVVGGLGLIVGGIALTRTRSSGTASGAG